MHISSSYASENFSSGSPPGVLRIIPESGRAHVRSKNWKEACCTSLALDRHRRDEQAAPERSFLLTTDDDEGESWRARASAT